MTITFRITETDQFRRLASHVRPSHYSLAIQPDFETLRFSGSVSIELQVLEETKFIEVNSLDLDFTRIEIKPRSSQGKLFLLPWN